MSQVHYSFISGLYFWFLIPVLIFFYYYASVKRKEALALFAHHNILSKINVSINNSNRLVKFILFCMGIFFLVWGLGRPGWDPKPRKVIRSGRDVVFMIDVSKSMLAEDLLPNRLERAKLAIIDCIETLDGDRVGLVAFAGSAVVKCPLTLDYGFFRSMVDDISFDSVQRGGTNVGDALRLVMKDVFDDQAKKYKDIILITDGEDHDSAPEFAAEEAGEKGIRILAFGLGDENTGRRIPVKDKTTGVMAFLKDQEGNEVWSRLDADMLRKLANLSAGGSYLNVATGSFDLGAVYRQFVASAEKREQESLTIQRYDEKFQIFFFIAFIILGCEPFISLRKRGRKDS